MFRPMRAEKAPADLTRLPYPLIASPKVDGWRVAIPTGSGPVTNSLKPVPNRHIQAMCSDPLLQGLDGEVIAGADPAAPGVHNTTQRACQAHDGTPVFTFLAFDDITTPGAGFWNRLVALRTRALPTFAKLLEQRVVRTPQELEAFEAECLAAGYEGVMLRHPRQPYKHGRSTAAEAGMLKLKRFDDIEAEVIGVEELRRNGNEATVNALGHTERSTRAAGLTPAGTLGALVCRAPGFAASFRVGTGFDGATRRSLWAERDRLVGRIAKVKHQTAGAVDAPRQPVFLGFRDAADIAA